MHLAPLVRHAGFPLVARTGEHSTAEQTGVMDAVAGSALLEVPGQHIGTRSGDDGQEHPGIEHEEVGHEDAANVESPAASTDLAVTTGAPTPDRPTAGNAALTKVAGYRIHGPLRT